MNKQPDIVKIRQDFLPLSGIVILFLLLGSIYLWLIPPFEGPDEAQHIAYIRWIITEGSLPPQGSEAWQTGIEQQSGQSPLYYFVASLPARLVDISNPPAVYRPNPYFIGPRPRHVFDNDNRAIHYPSDTNPLRGGWLALYLARGVTLTFGALLVISVYGLARQIWPEPRTVALSAAFLVAVTPQVLYISSMASNDIPAAALSTLAIWLFAVYWRQHQTLSPIWAVAVGIVLGLAGLTKVSAFVWAIPIGLGLSWLWLSGRRSLGQVMQFGLTLTLSVMAVAGWWLVRNWLFYGSPFGLDPHNQTPWAIPPGAQLDPFLLRWLEVWRSYWLALGWGTIRLGYWPSSWPYTLFFLLLFLALVGWLYGIWLWRRQPEKRPEVTNLIFLSFLLVGVLVTAAFLESWMHRVMAPHGRLLFPASGAITLFLILGWRHLHPRLPLLACSYIAALGILTPFILIYPAYTHTTLTPAEIAALPPAIGWRFGETSTPPFAELISFTPRQTTIYAGEILQVELCWRALAIVEQEYSVMVQIIGPENGLISSRRSYPGEGRHPTSLWQPGQVWCENFHLSISPDLESTLVYRLEVGIFDEVNNRRLTATDSTGNLLSHTFIDAVRLVQPATQQFITGLPTTPNLHLVNDQHSSTWQIGVSTSLTLTWVVPAPVTQDYQVFIHLRDLQTGENIFQVDGPPVQGWYPSSWWSPNELIADVRTFTIPADLLPGTYRLVVGMYDLATGTRPIPEIDLGVVQIEP